ncbi:LamG domain-containing protein [Sphingomonas parva]|uniref:LamG domain-containing protein n=1 Tax=Sphingomonas parva TaxID=2555898 RepID=A0A4Y8ZNH9_9SPHN|nr:LamG domain-containing protein [Sphingomonas parva]TFI57570.1 LamG domain-containing protein [Sphingomonas parva]
MARPADVTRRVLASAALALLPWLAACAHEQGASGGATAWRFDRIDRIGNMPVRAEGGPQVIETEHGKAVAFDGLDDALFLPTHPLAGASKFTIEAVFRPDGGAFEQRWLHLAEASGNAPPDASPPVPPSGPRFLFEIRVVGDRWYLDAFTAGNGYNKALMAPDKTFPVGRWYHVAQTYDGRTYRAYVDGVLQTEAEIAFTPQAEGFTSIGTRINRRNYFHGAVLSARFTPRALPPERFHIPGKARK